ncbi:hypothetical protein Hanom_Chr09g00811521 [Helianthus anomalus]
MNVLHHTNNTDSGVLLLLQTEIREMKMDVSRSRSRSHIQWFDKQRFRVS